MSKRKWLAVSAALAAVLVAGGLFASNMGFRLQYQLDATGVNGSASGTSSIGLPFNQMVSLSDAEDLINDINTVAGGAVVTQIQRFDPTTDALVSYTGALSDPPPFSLSAGEGYLVQVSSGVTYPIVGSHNPAFTVSLNFAGTASGTSRYAPPYHASVADAQLLINEINTQAGSTAVVQIQRFDPTTDTLVSYTGAASDPPAFAIKPGEAYLVQVNTDVSYVPGHF